MTRVVYDYQIFSFQEYGGVSRYFCELASRIGRMEGFSATVLAPLSCNRLLRESAADHVGVYLPRVRMTGGLFRAVNRLAWPLLVPRGNSRIVHETYYSKSPTAPRKSRTVLTVFDMIHEKFGTMFPPADQTSAAKRSAVRRADAIICISETTRRDLLELFGVPEDKTSVVYLGHTLGRGRAAESGDRKATLLYVGARGSYKNFDALLQAYAASTFLQRNVTVTAFGGGPFTRDEISRMRELKIRGDAVQYARGDDEVLATLYATSAALVYPSLYEGFGIPPLEAMACGCPVICSNASAIKEVVGDAGRYFDPRNVESMRTALEDAISNSTARRSLIEKGWQRSELFTWHTCAAATARVYRGLVG